MREPLLLPLAALAAGILLSRLAGFDPGELCWPLAALALLAITGLLLGTRRAALVSALLALVFAGALLDVLRRPGPPPELDTQPREIVILGGCVIQPPVLFEDREQFVLELEPGARVRVNLYLKEGEQPPRLRYGQRVELEARIRRPRNFENPGAFDYAAYLARNGVYWTASAVSGSPVTILRGECGSHFHKAIFALRTASLEGLDRLYGDDPQARAVLAALLVGDSSRLERVWIDQFRRTGTYHTLVISGLHLTVLAAFLLFLLRLCGFGLGITLLATSSAAWIYALVTGWETPVIRAAAGLTLFLVGGYFYRRRRLLNVLAAIAIVFLLLDPEQLLDASFHLSFLAVALIGALAVPLLERTSVPYGRGLSGLSEAGRDGRLEPKVAQFRVELRLLAETVELWIRIPRRWCLVAMGAGLRVIFYAYELVTVSAVIQIGLALPMAVYFHRVSFSGFSANALVVPMMSLAVPAGFLAVATGWVPLAALAKWLVTASLNVASWHAAWEPNWRIPDPPWWVGAAFLAGLLSVAATVRVLKKLRPAAFALLAVSMALLLWHPFKPAVEAGKLELTAIDVGQGESLLVTLPERKLMLVDGGGIPVFGGRARPRLDIGEDVVSPYLWSRSIRRLEVIVATHAHDDHIGGLPALIENFRPTQLWTGVMVDSPAWQVLSQKATERGVEIVPLAEGQKFRFGGALIEVLAPRPDYVPGKEPRNNDSLVLRLAYGHHAFLLTGDAERQSETAMLSGGLIERADVLKIGHHGGRTSSLPQFLAALRPAFALVSAGFENPYRLPHPEVLDRLREHGTAILRTDLSGLVTVRTDGRRFEMETQRSASRTERRITRRSPF